MRKLQGPTVGSALLALILLSAGVTQAADHAVNVGPGFVFSPAAITIAPGDTVTWTWVSGSHSIVSGPGCTADGGFDSGLSSTPGTTFTSPVGFYDTTGAYPYFCGFGSHCSVLNMKGTVTVEGPPPTPKVPSMGTVALLATALLMGILTIWMGRVRSRRACDEVRPARQP